MTHYRTRLIVSADVLAVGLVAACREFNVDPLRVMTRGVPRAMRARLAVGAALASLADAKKRSGLQIALAGVLNVSSNHLAPSGLRKVGITTEHLLTLAEAMREAGLQRDFIRVEPRPTSSVGAAKVQSAPAGLASPDAVRPTRRRIVEAAPPRLPDVVYSDTSGRPLDLGAGDADLVSACLAQGGFPRALTLADGRAVWVGHQDKPWRFAGPAPRRRKAPALEAMG